MDKNTKKFIGILNTIDEIVEYLIDNDIEDSEYLLDDLNNAIEICNEFALSVITNSTDNISRLSNYYSDIMLFISRIKNYKEQWDIGCLEDKINKWSEYCIELIMNNKSEYTGSNKVYILNTDDYPLPEEGENIYDSREKFSSIARGPESPLVSILVIAYNRIEKTKQCVESILKYTKNINYELILVDNGSDKDIFEYYESIRFINKKIVRITKNLQLSYAVLKGTEYCSGKYIALLGNDIVVTANWLENIIRCFESDIKIGMVCAMSSNISNLQQTDISFQSIEEMQEKAAIYNVSDPRKWHERLRLITAGAVYKAECIHISGNWDYGFFHDFSDDDLTFHIRRAGYKTILCKDVFVHHDHVIGTEKRQGEFERSLAKGRENFRSKYYGIDAWDDVNNFELTMNSMLKKPKNINKAKILGIDVKCGTPVLELKNNLRSYGLFNSEISSLFSDGKYVIDLSTICTGTVICDSVNKISCYFEDGIFDYILIGEPINTYENHENLILSTIKTLKPGGQLLFKLSNSRNLMTFLNIVNNGNNYPEVQSKLVKPNDIRNVVESCNCKIEDIKYEYFNVNDDSKVVIFNAIKNTGLSNDIEATFDELLINNYVYSIIK